MPEELSMHSLDSRGGMLFIGMPLVFLKEHIDGLHKIIVRLITVVSHLNGAPRVFEELCSDNSMKYSKTNRELGFPTPKWHRPFSCVCCICWGDSNLSVKTRLTIPGVSFKKMHSEIPKF